MPSDSGLASGSDSGSESENEDEDEDEAPPPLKRTRIKRESAPEAEETKPRIGAKVKKEAGDTAGLAKTKKRPAEADIEADNCPKRGRESESPSFRGSGISCTALTCVPTSRNCNSCHACFEAKGGRVGSEKAVVTTQS